MDQLLSILEGPSEEHSKVSTPKPSLVKTVLTEDVILDNILTELDVQDIVSLRQVSSQYHRLTREAVTWKRLIDRAEHPLPPLPPSERYSFANLSAIEAERLLARAVSLPKRWDKRDQIALRRWDIEAYRSVLEMALLPGGQYMVASVTDRSRTRFSIEVFTSDFGYSMGIPIARVDTRTKAYHLRVKYMAVDGVQGIAIAYVRRDYRRERYADRFDINAIPPEANPHTSMIKYECSVVHIPLKSLELYCDEAYTGSSRKYMSIAMQEPRPFHLLTEIVSRSRISNLIMDEDVDGTPYIAVLKNPDRILFKNLNGGLGCTITCQSHPDFLDLRHAILAFTILPAQNQFLVVRRAGTNQPPPTHDPATDPPHPGPFYFAELYPFVYASDTSATLIAASRSAPLDAAGNFWKKVWISEPDRGPSARDPTVRAHVARRMGAPPPPPVIIFVQAEKTYGIVYEALFPSAVPAAAGPGPGEAAAAVAYEYALAQDVPLLCPETLPEGVDALADVYEHRVLPGSVRPLICTVPRDDGSGSGRAFEIRMLGGVWDERLVGKDWKVESGAGTEGAMDVGGDVVGDAADIQADVAGGSGGEDVGQETDAGAPRVFSISPEDLSDVSAVAWDETIGRLCVGYAKDTRIAVFDFAPGAVVL